MVEIKLTKEQYERLIKVVYLGNWMINAIRIHGEEYKEYEDIAQHIYSFSKILNVSNLIEYDSESNKFYPTRELEEDSDAEQFKQEYDDENFWDNLVDILARRDFIREYGEDTIRKMSWKQRMTKEHPFIEKYEEEFERNGVERLEITERS